MDIAPKEVFCQRRDIFRPLSYGRKVYRNHFQSVIQVLTKSAFTDQLFQFLVGSSYYPDINLYRLRCANPSHFVFLQDA